MTSLYNLTELQGADTVIDIVTYANTASLGMLAGGFVIALYLVIVWALKNEPVSNRMMASGFVCVMVCLMFNYADLLGFKYTFTFLILTAIATIFKVMTDKSSS